MKSRERSHGLITVASRTAHVGERTTDAGARRLDETPARDIRRFDSSLRSSLNDR